MRKPIISRRDVLKASGALVASGALGTRVLAAAPPATAVTPALIEAAKKEGKVVFYTSIDLPVAERLAKAFEARYPGIAVRVERTGAERVFQRIGQEYASRIHAVDVVEFVRRRALHRLEARRPARGVCAGRRCRASPDEHKDPDGMFATFRAWVCVIGYNTKMVKPEDAPKSYADLLDPKWVGKIVKAHPSYSGTIMTATYQMSRDLGWELLREARQAEDHAGAVVGRSAEEAGARRTRRHGRRQRVQHVSAQGEGQSPVEIVYATEGSPLIVGPNAIFKRAPNPNAARLFQSFMFSPEAQQLSIDFGGLRSVHPKVNEKPGRLPFSEVKKMKDDPVAVEKMSEEIKTRYSKMFGV